MPYRNSTLTSVLRDSLGGNCRTAMVATVQPVATQIEESIATCRFAQRVAMISNKVQVNEEVDAAAVIRRLKGEVRELKEEARLRYTLVLISRFLRCASQCKQRSRSQPLTRRCGIAQLRMARGEAEGETRGPLTPDELASIREAVEAFVADASSPLETRGSLMRVRAVQDTLRSMLLDGAGPGADAVAAAAAEAAADAAEACRRFALQLFQRDHELGILLGILDGRTVAAAMPQPAGLSLALPAGAEAPPLPGSFLAPDSALARASAQDVEGLEARARAFEAFRRSFRRAAAAEESAGAALAAAAAAAKTVAERVNAAAARIPSAVAALERRGAQRAAAAVAASLSGDASSDPRVVAASAAEAAAAADAEAAKAEYRGGMEALRTKRAEIESAQRELDACRLRTQRDFDAWLAATVPREAPESDAAEAEAEAEAAAAAEVAAAAAEAGYDDAFESDELAQAGAEADAEAEAEVAPAYSPPAAARPVTPAAPVAAAAPPAPPAPAPPPAVEMTGDEEADEDIRAFLEAKQRRLAKQATAAAAQ